jgi:predicted Zn-dependent protease
VYFVAGFAPEAEFATVDGAVVASLNSFRELSRAEADAIRPNRVDFYVVRPGDTWQSIATRAGGSIVRAAQLALMNGYEVNVQPTAGDRIKIVVAG